MKPQYLQTKMGKSHIPKDGEPVCGRKGNYSQAELIFWPMCDRCWELSHQDRQAVTDIFNRDNYEWGVIWHNHQNDFEGWQAAVLALYHKPEEWTDYELALFGIQLKDTWTDWQD